MSETANSGSGDDSKDAGRDQDDQPDDLVSRKAERKRQREKQRRIHVNRGFDDLLDALVSADVNVRAEVRRREQRKGTVLRARSAESEDNNVLSRIEIIAKANEVVTRLHRENEEQKATISRLREELEQNKRRRIGNNVFGSAMGQNLIQTAPPSQLVSNSNLLSAAARLPLSSQTAAPSALSSSSLALLNLQGMRGHLSGFGGSGMNEGLQGQDPLTRLLLLQQLGSQTNNSLATPGGLLTAASAISSQQRAQGVNLNQPGQLANPLQALYARIPITSAVLGRSPAAIGNNLITGITDPQSEENDPTKDSKMSPKKQQGQR